jgi:acetyltransferase-like isoleucine patch superfamily enzyme
VIEGDVTIGKGCVIGPHAVVRGTNLADGEVVKPFEIRE